MLLPWNWLKRRVSVKEKCCGYFSHPLGAIPEAFRLVDIAVEARANNCNEPF